jgi:hypothetical protein
MAQSKPNKTFKSPHKQQIEEWNKQDKTETTTNITPHATKTKNKATGTDERSKEDKVTHKKYIRNPENIPYYEGDSIYRRIYRNDRNKQLFNEAGDIVNSSDEDFMQPSDEDAQGNVLAEKELAIIRMNDSQRTQGNVLTEKELASARMSDSHQTPIKQESKPVAQP